jgi:CTP synthase (UTP-ammonia lyase)
VKELRGSGLSPDLIVCRSEMPIIDEVKQKISNFCHVKPDRVGFSHIFKGMNIVEQLLYTGYLYP